ncbi:hypothetical protein BJF85_14180 [Saccharomonospora sp. CUA-673]|nr:hypothetical protein [Saccharomonospora sp. CUA-673]OLT48015.1 hypothetical protein BJF85_14180 [Saccharomonospora sp. CUA-673]
MGERADEAWRPIRPSKRVDRGGDWLYQSDEAGDPAAFSVSEYRERLLGGPGSELYGSHGAAEPSDAPYRESPDFSSGYHVPYSEQSLSGRNDLARDVDGYDTGGRYDDPYDSGYRERRSGYDTGEFHTGGFGTGQFRSVTDTGSFTPSPVPRQSSNDSYGAERINLGGSGATYDERPRRARGSCGPTSVRRAGPGRARTSPSRR